MIKLIRRLFAAHRGPFHYANHFAAARRALRITQEGVPQ